MSKSSTGWVALLCMLFLSCWSCIALSAEPTLTSWHNLNDVMSVDYEDGVLAVGTRAGLIILRDGEMMILTEADGLPSDEVLNVAILDRNTFYIGPFGRIDWEQYMYELTLDGDSISLRDITPYPRFMNLYNYGIGVSPQGMLWILDGYGLHRFDGESWMHYPPPVDHWDWGDYYVRSQLTFDLDGNVWCADYMFDGHVFDGSSWSEVSDEAFFNPTTFGVDPQGRIWCMATSRGNHTGALYVLNGSGWQLVVEDEILEGPYGARTMSFDNAGNVWIMSNSRLGLYDGKSVQLVMEADGFQLDRYCPLMGRGPTFSSSTVIPPGAFYFGLYGYGLLSGQGADLHRVYFEDSLPGNYIIDMLVDRDGQLLARSGYTSVIGQFDGQRWHHWDAPWLAVDSEAILSPESELALDLDGSVWARSWEGAVRRTDSGEKFYDDSNSELHGWGTIAIDRDGIKWFTDDLGGSEYRRDVVSFDGETWRRYPATEYFKSQDVNRITVGHDNAIWFRHCDYYEGGYTVFDGRSWRHLEFGTDIPSGFVYFDHEGNTYISWGALYRNSGDGVWNEIANFGVADLQVDSSGVLWCGTYEKVYTLRDEVWHEEPFSDVICAPEENILDPMQGVLRILIDHNGDKWFGTPIGVHRIQDGGPAQQKLELSVEEEAGGYVTVNGTFTNAGAVIPVLLWLACEHNGSLYYYPTWGPTPEGAKRILGAYSVETEELLRLDTSALPPGDYTFYGGISLLGGIDLLIGARDNKIAIATYHQ